MGYTDAISTETVYGCGIYQRKYDTKWLLVWILQQQMAEKLAISVFAIFCLNLLTTIQM